MSKEHPFILYVGSLEFGQALSAAAETRGWHVMCAQDDLEALAMYTVYAPDVIVIDQSTDFADEVEFHLRSVNAELVLTHQPVNVHDAECKAILDSIAARSRDVLPAQESRRVWTTGTVST